MSWFSWFSATGVRLLVVHNEESIVLTARGSIEVRSEAVGFGMDLRNF